MKTITILYWCPGWVYYSDAYTIDVPENELTTALQTLHSLGWRTKVMY